MYGLQYSTKLVVMSWMGGARAPVIVYLRSRLSNDQKPVGDSLTSDLEAGLVNKAVGSLQ
jgi:hypothetical protein